MLRSCKHVWVEIRFATYSIVECRNCYEVREIDQ